jgi:hypothetical protein
VRLRDTSQLLDIWLVDGGEVVNVIFLQVLPLPHGKVVALLSVVGSVEPTALLSMEGSDECKNPMKSSEIEPATVQPIA